MARIRGSARRVVGATTGGILAASLVLATPAVAAGERAAPRPDHGNTPVDLSAEPERLKIRQCLPETLDLLISSRSSEPTYADVTIEPESPVQTSRRYVSTYVPADYPAVVPVRVSVPERATAGEYAVVFESGRRERLTVPVTAVVPPGKQCIPRGQMSATASSAQTPAYPASNAIDKNDATIWHTRYSPTKDSLPQSITFDLGRAYDVAELAYQPRTDGTLNGTITAYTVYASTDGQDFVQVGAGTWAADTSRKTAVFDAAGARYIRLEATQGYRDFASAAEIALFGQPAP